MKTIAITSIGMASELEETCSGPRLIPPTANAVASATASRYTGNDQIRSSPREITPSVAPPAYPAATPRISAMPTHTSADRPPTISEMRPP